MQKQGHEIEKNKKNTIALEVWQQNTPSFNIIDTVRMLRQRIIIIQLQVVLRRHLESVTTHLREIHYTNNKEC